MSDKFLMNRMANANNPYQGGSKRVLCVCSAGLLRSPTAAEVLSRPPYLYNTRAAGLSKEFALIPVDKVLLSWAEEVVCMTEEQATALKAMLGPVKKPVLSLNIDDSYAFRDRDLVKLILKRYNEKREQYNEQS